MPTTQHVHSTAIGGFAAASNYDKVRAGYTRESVEFFLTKLDLIGEHGQDKKAEGSLEPVTVLELGCGTGKFTRVMLDVLKDADVRIIASDPLESMCSQFQELLPDVKIMQCAAQNIALPDSSADVVIAAQSFHWFAKPEALAEIDRVLAPGGKLGIVFNLPDESQEWVKELNCFFLPLYHQQSVPTPLDDVWKKVLLSSDRFCDHTENTSFRLFQESSIEAALAMFASLSVVENGSNAVKATLKELFDLVIKTHFTDKGRKFRHIPYVTTMMWCEKNKM